MKMDAARSRVYKIRMSAKNQTVIILAGGQSRRMGQDKAVLRLGGTRLIDHVLERVFGQCETVMISGRQDYGTGLRIIPDLDKGPKGPAAGLFAACQAKLPGEGFFTVPVDAPRVPLHLCERLFGPGSAIAAAPDGTHQAFAWWVKADLMAAFEALGKDDSVSLKHLAKLCGARTVIWPNASGFINLNTPQDVEAFQAVDQE